MRLKGLMLAVLVGGVALIPGMSKADTLQLVSAPNSASNGTAIYPYNFSVDGSSTLTSLMCLNLNKEVTIGETWNVAIQAIGLDSSTLSTGYRADAWIYSQLTSGKYSISDIQYAVWSIFDPTDAKNSSAWDSTAASLASLGMSAANNSSLIASNFFSGYQVYVPTSNTSGWTAGTPQSFIGVDPTPTPEPSSLALLGTSILGAAGMVRRRFRRA